MSVPANGTALTLMRKLGRRGKIPWSTPEEHNMRQHIPEEFFTRLMD
jgi:hypothetical protein